MRPAPAENGQALSGFFEVSILTCQVGRIKSQKVHLSHKANPFELFKIFKSRFTRF